MADPEFDPVPDAFRLSDAERAAGLAHVAAMRARLTGGDDVPHTRHRPGDVEDGRQ